MNRKWINIFICAVVTMAGCAEKKSASLFEQPQGTGIDFVNTVADNDSINILNYRNFYNGGGVAIGDINNDGLADIFFTANQGQNKLYLNKGNWKFEDISTQAGFLPKTQFSTGVVMADVNADGWLDIYVCNAGNMEHPELRKNQLFINNHQLGFTEQAAAYGLAEDGYSTQASFFDYDLDGDLDCFIIDNSPIPVNSLNYPQQRDVPANQWKVADNLKGGGDHLYRNDAGKFVEVTQEAGIHGTLMSFGLGVNVADINGDQYPDIFVSNDFFERDYLYINQRDGSFKDELTDWMQHISYASMGADIGDINNDGYPEIFTTDMLPANDYRLKTTLSFDDINQYRLKERNGFYHQFLQNTLQLNNGNGRFTDVANFSGVNASEWSWGALLFDANNDGLNDLYVCNGIFRDLTNQDFLDFDANTIKEQMLATGKKSMSAIVEKIPSIAVPNKMFCNQGQLRFADSSSAWGFSTNSFSNGSAYGDLDNDGDLDLVVNNVNEPAFILRNNTKEWYPDRHTISVQLSGTEMNRFAVGTTVKVFAGDQVWSRELIPSRGFQSSVDYKMLIGLGSSKPDSMLIIWPDRHYTRLLSPPLDSLLDIVYDPGTPLLPIPEPEKSNTWPILDLGITAHKENDFTDFYEERGIPVMSSARGPVAAVADIDGDGMEDIYIGGSLAQPGQIYRQLPNGRFEPIQSSLFSSFRGFEDGAAVFFDADADGDKDLFIGASDNQTARAGIGMQHRLFLNDGKGHFSRQLNAFPPNLDNIGAAIAFDLDHDGDLDLFAGAICVTGEYGLTPLSHVYLNDGSGHFTDLPVEKMGGLDKAGNITSAAWAALTGPQPQLIVAGNWMAPKIYSWENGRFIEKQSGLSGLTGWWQTMKLADLDGDGKEDLILGNYGQNFYLHPYSTHPVKLWIADFDQNGRADKIITRTVDGQDKPIFMKHETESQLPGLKKQNLHHAVYATRSIEELFSPEERAAAQQKEVRYTASCIAWNEGNGRFTVRELPEQLQLSSIAAIAVLDINQDGKPDIVTAGNEFGFQPQLGRLDGNNGILLMNEGNRKLAAVAAANEKIPAVTGMTRSIAVIGNGKNKKLLFLRNNDSVVGFQLPED